MSSHAISQGNELHSYYPADWVGDPADRHVMAFRWDAVLQDGIALAKQLGYANIVLISALRQDLRISDPRWDDQFDGTAPYRVMLVARDGRELEVGVLIPMRPPLERARGRYRDRVEMVDELTKQIKAFQKAQSQRG
jgi:hypothetical protein